MDLTTFLKQPNQQGSFPAELSPRGGYITFRNSGRRGDYKYFQLGLDSFLTTLKDLKDNIAVFQPLNRYNETSWRNAGSAYYTDLPANAMSTVQTKPLFSTLSKIIVWANQPDYDNINTEQAIILDIPALDQAISKLEILAESYRPRNVIDAGALEISRNMIFFGSPGTGKSTRIKSITANQGEKTIITFHPDTDYSAFVGGFKPTKAEESSDITYSFVPQSFTKAYIKAWKNLKQNHFLIIEEINRGNCAQIFGDIFQLLDRRADGFSEYPIDIDTDLANYLKAEFGISKTYIDLLKATYPNENISDYSKIALPPNLYIFATMNTSDQSLFPMDSAFKRRWDWEYIPINYTDADTLSIQIGEDSYNWGKFLKIINPKIKDITNSEDKQIGNRFINPPDNKTISFEQFRSKVLFYLWFEIYKEESNTSETIFRTSPESEFSFGDLFISKDRYAEEQIMITNFLRYNGLEKDEQE